MGNWFRTMVLFAALAGLLMLVGGAVAGQRGALIAFFISLAINFFSYWFSDKMVLASYGAKEVTEAEAPRLHAVVGELSQRAGIPKPRVYRIPDESPNAFATGRNPEHAAVAVTDGIVRLLSEEELKGVLAHELAHVKHRDILIGTVAASIASAIMFIASMARWAAIFGGGRSDDRDGGFNPIGLLVAAVVAPVAALLIQMAISRSREYAADAGGAAYAGNPYGLAEALKKLDAWSKRVPLQASPATSHMFIVKPFTGGGLFSLFSTHPPIPKRIERLMGMRG
ncbi:MAG: zinc metalloprotease HtpX [Acidobacteriota bacterium]